MDRISELPFDDSVRGKLRRLVQMVQEYVPGVHKIILFGSYARAEQTAGSDLDLMVLAGEQIPRDIQAGLRADFEDSHADVVFYSEESFAESDCLLARNIRRDGILLWKR